MSDGATLEAIVRVKNEASKALNQVVKDVEGTDKALKGSQVGINKTGSAFDAAGVKAKLYSLVSVAALSYVANEVIQTAKAFDSGMANIKTVLGDNEQQFKVLREGILDFAKTSIKPLGELTDAMYDVVSAGIAEDKQLQTLKDSEKLAASGLGSVKEAVDIVTSSMNAFGVDSTKAIESVFTATKYGKTTVAELSQGFGAVAATAKEMGVSYDEFLAITAAGTTTGKKAAQLWTEQKAIFTNLIKPTEAMSALYKKLGVEDGKQLIATYGGLVPALKAVSDASGGNLTEMGKLFSSSEALNLTTQILSGSYETYKKTLEDMGDANSSIDAAYAAQKATAEGLWNTLQNNLSVVMIQLATAILPILIPAIQALTAVIQFGLDAWNSLSGEARIAIGVLTAITAVVVGFPMIITGAIAAVGLFGAALSFLAANPVVIILAAIVVAIITVDQALKKHGMSWQELGQIILNSVMQAAAWVADGIASMMESLASIPGPAQAAFKEMAAAARGGAETMKNNVMAGEKKLNQMHEKNMQEFAKTTLDKINNMKTQLPKLTGEAHDKMVSDINNAYTEFKNGTGKTVTEVIASANEISGEASASLQEPGAQSGAWGNHLGQNYANGIRSSKPAVSAAVGELKAILNTVHQSYNPEIPVQLWGEHFVQNFAAGVRATQPVLFAETNKMANILKDRFKGDGDIMKTLKEWKGDKVLAEKFQEIAEKVKAEAQKIDQEFEGMKKDYKSLNDKAGEELDQFKKKHQDTIDEIDKKIQVLKKSLADLSTSFSVDNMGLDKSIGTEIVKQQDLVAQLKKQLEDAQKTAEGEKAKDQKKIDNTEQPINPEDLQSIKDSQAKKDQDIAAIKDKYQKESEVLKTFLTDNKQYEDEIAEAKRRNSLTDFERFMEDAELKREEIKKQYEEKKKQLDDEILLLQDQRAKEQKLYSEKMAQYAETAKSFRRMQIIINGGMDSMALNAQQKVDFMKKKLEELAAAYEAFNKYKPPSLTDNSNSLPPPAIKKFATGGIIDKPTLAMMGEGTMSEAVVPLPGGKAIPVQFKGASGTTGGGQKIELNFGDIYISKEVDGDAFLDKMEGRIARILQRNNVASH